MVELIQTRQLKRAGKPFPLMNLISRNSCNKKDNHSMPSLGSGIVSPTISNSIVRHNDPYMPHISRPQRSSSTSLPCPPQKQTVPRATNTSTPQLVAHHSRQTGPNLHYYSMPLNERNISAHSRPTSPLYHSQHYHSSSQLPPLSPPLSPPPLSPTNRSFAASVRPSWRDMQRPPTYQPASSLSSTDSEEEDDDDDEPLGLICSAAMGKPFSLLSDASEDGDDDLVPIARLSISRNSVHHMSAAEKYKAKVRARLHMGSTNSTTPLLD